MSEEIDSRPPEPTPPNPSEASPWKHGGDAAPTELPFAAHEQHRHDAAAWRVYEVISAFPDAEAFAILALALARLTLNRTIQQREKERPEYVEK